MTYINFWYCMGAAVIAIAGTYILWGPSNRPKRKKNNSVPGLLNLGNSCFLNAVLQALAACPFFVGWLQNIVSTAGESVLSDKCVLIKALLSVLNALNSSEEVCSGSVVIEALRAHRWIITNEEQDAHELFHVLTTTIEEELTSVKPVLSLLEASMLTDESSCEEDENLPKKSFISSSNSSTRIPSPVCGLFVSDLKCNSCSSKFSARYDNFDSISLNIPTSHWQQQLTLQDLLMKFISCELVQDVTCAICSRQSADVENSNNKLKTVFSKQLSFGKLPKCLCIHVQRKMWLKNGLTVKCYDYVSFPEVLVMDYYVRSHMKKNELLGANYNELRLTGGNSVKAESSAVESVANKEDKPVINRNVLCGINKGHPLCYNYVYLLKAVIVHLGDTSSGHFITYRRGATNTENEQKWFCLSDLEVKEVPFSEVSKSCAYMLFYEKLDPKSEKVS